MPEHLRITHLHRGCCRSPPQVPGPVPGQPQGGGAGACCPGQTPALPQRLCGIKQHRQAPAKAKDRLHV